MLDTITYGTYIFFAAFCLLAMAFTYFCIPETRGKVRRPGPIFIFPCIVATVRIGGG
jgi:hypothetical protein